MRFIDLAVFVTGLTSVGIGIALKDPPSAMVTVGGILISVVVLSRYQGVRKQ